MTKDPWEEWAKESEGMEDFGERKKDDEPTSEEMARAFQIAFDELMQNIQFSSAEKEAFKIYLESNIIVESISERRMHHMYMLCLVRQLKLLGYNNPNPDAEE